MNEYDQKSLSFTVRCSKGTYIRSLARDIAKKAGSCGHLTYLQRISSGVYHVNDSVTLEQLAEYGVERYLISIAESLPDFKRIVINDEQLKKASLGNALYLPEYQGDSEPFVVILSPSGEAVAIGNLVQGTLQPKKVFV